MVLGYAELGLLGDLLLSAVYAYVEIMISTTELMHAYQQNDSTRKHWHSRETEDY